MVSLLLIFSDSTTVLTSAIRASSVIFATDYGSIRASLLAALISRSFSSD